MNNNEKIIHFLKSKPGYLKKSALYISATLGVSEKDAKNALKAVRNNSNISESKPIDPKKFKRLFFDIETSYNVVSSWRVGYDINITPDNIIKERGIICVCWKWAGESKVHSLEWNKGDDKQLLKDFIKVFDSADEIIGQNSDKFDIKWLRTRCIFHGVPMLHTYQTLDTLKLARSGFNFNSNKLDYLGKFLGIGGKKDTGGFKLWQDIVERNDVKAMKHMIEYCKQDVVVLEKVFDKLNPYTKSKTHVGVILGKDKTSCPNCGSDHSKNHGYRYLASGTKKQIRLCLSCGKSYSLSCLINK